MKSEAAKSGELKAAFGIAGASITRNNSGCWCADADCIAKGERYKKQVFVSCVQHAYARQ